ncbi:short chain dehydrogenase/reductase [Apiospora aurea]|uniref:Short chain dehydrogenase/reductase n=1 Tax=Apiospora aurea TaxID=335848 RepID=A0ABR1QAG2_9PEZI
MACRSLDKANAAKAEIEAGGITGSISTVQLDVTDDASIEQAAAAVERQFGRLDVLVNNAAMGVSDLGARARFLKTMETNTFGPFQVAKAFRPLLLKSSTAGAGAYSIYVTSGQGSLAHTFENPPHPNTPPDAEAYNACKAALNMYMLLDWRQSRQAGAAVRVFGMCPGFVVSNLRGPSEAARNPGGAAQDPRESGKLVLSIVQGQRDADEGRVVRSEGTWPW